MGNEIEKKINSEIATDFEKKPLQVVCFKLGDQEFCLDIMQVQEIIRGDEITGVSSGPDFVEGVVNLPEKAIPVIDLRKRFGIDSIGPKANSRVVVVDIDEHTIGLIVDAVSEVLRLQTSSLESTSKIETPLGSKCIGKVAALEDRVLMLLDPSKLLSQSEIKLINRI